MDTSTLLTTALAVLALLAPRPAAVDGAQPFGDGSSAGPTVGAPDETIEVSLSELTKVKYEVGKPLPKKILDLDGKNVVITGVMHADTGYDVKSFLLVTESCECAASPLPTHFVEVTLTSGTTSRKRGEMSYRGKFSVGEELDENGFVKSLYRLEGGVF